MVGDSWWGFIGFDDCRARREWAPVEIEALKTATITPARALGYEADLGSLESGKLTNELRTLLSILLSFA